MPATPFCMYFFACYVEFYHPYLQRWIVENLFYRQNFAQLKKGAIPVEVPASDVVNAKSLPIASGNAVDTQDTNFV
jgi:hypothetical protein